MTTNTVPTNVGAVRRDVRGIPLEHTIGDGSRDPFIGACPTWCEGEHTHWEEHADRSHFSEPVDIALELEHDDYDAVSHTNYVMTLRTYLQQHYRETEPRVFLARGERAGLQMTLAEATLLRDRLSALLEAADR